MPPPGFEQDDPSRGTLEQEDSPWLGEGMRVGDSSPVTKDDFLDDTLDMDAWNEVLEERILSDYRRPCSHRRRCYGPGK